jgi:hypothetical protein
MSLENGTAYTKGDMSPAHSTERPVKHHLEDLVKESFVPTAGHTVRTRKVLVRRKKQMQELSPFAAICAWVVENQIGTIAEPLPSFFHSSIPSSALVPDNRLLGLSVNLLLLLALTHASIPRARVHTRKFFKMSYYHAEAQNYTQGWEDAYFVLFWIIVITGARVAVMDYMLKPIARFGGIRSKKTETRFAEQGWLVVYYSLFWTLGMVRTFPLSPISMSIAVGAIY